MSAATISAEPRNPRRAVRPARETAAMVFFVAAQFLLPGLLMIPGSQKYRFVIRAIPYASSLLLLAYFAGKRRRVRLPPGGIFIGIALAILAINLPRPDSPSMAGIAQLVFQVAIAAPLFWGAKMVANTEDLYRLLRLFFLANAIGTVVGALQVINPDVYLPRDFGMAKESAESLSYKAASGKKMYRPPGLSDVPWGAAVTGSLTAFSGILLMSDARLTLIMRLACLAMAGLGVFDIYMCHVRSLLLVTAAAILVASFLMAMQGRLRQAGLVWLALALVVVGAFSYAVRVGGEATAKRFLRVADEGLATSFEKNRGGFVIHTFNWLLPQYPLGAGVGRWGMMNVYFADRKDKTAPPPLYAEIQITGWLLDGGVPMWFFYGGGILIAMGYSLRLASRARGRELEVLAIYVFGFGVLIATQAFASPTFNTSMGIQFWALFGALHGAAVGEAQRAA